MKKLRGKIDSLKDLTYKYERLIAVHNLLIKNKVEIPDNIRVVISGIDKSINFRVYDDEKLVLSVPLISVVEILWPSHWVKWYPVIPPVEFRTVSK